MQPITITSKSGPAFGRLDYTLTDLAGAHWRVQQKDADGEFFLSKNGKELARFQYQQEAFKFLWQLCAKPDLHTHP